MQVLSDTIQYLPRAGIIDLLCRYMVKALEDQRDAINCASTQRSKESFSWIHILCLSHNVAFTGGV